MTLRSKSDKLAVAALRRLERLQRAECFDPVNLESRATPDQQAVLDDLGSVQIRYVTAGNQCLAEGTEVLTPEGPKKIQDILPGDTVYSEYGKPIRVKEVFSNGRKEVIELTNRGMQLAEATENHVFLTSSINRPEKEKKVSEFTKDTRIRRIEVNAPLGSICEPHAYSIGVFLGDGCSRTPGKVISSGDPEVVYAVGAELSSLDITKSPHNYNWRIKGNPHCNYYSEWCEGRYAHEKVVDLDIIRGWDRDSLLRYVAGIIDTDGSVYVDTWGNINITLEMQSRTVVESIQYAMLALWQTTVTIRENNREKYVNGPTYSIACRNNAYTKRMLRELDKYLRVPHKKWRDEYECLDSKRTNPDWIGIKKGNRRIVETYDIHVDSPTNLYLLANGLVTHNSGKSQLAAREVTWVFSDTHPVWSRPSHWSDEPLLILVLGRTTKQIEETLFRKIEAFLEPGTYKVVRQGGVIQKITHNDNGNTILFLSHHSDREAREKVQSFVAHYVWLDEMPGSYQLIEELHRRIQAKGGYFLATFTPKAVNRQIQKLVDSADGVHSKKYKFRMFDNPIYSEKDKQAILATLVSASDSYRKTILDGDWAVGEEQVYEFNWDSHVEFPEGYNPTTWRHVESVDPALSSKFGLTVWAENPRTGIWYCVVADYITGILNPVEVLAEVRKRTENYNIVRRICDPHEVWYLGTAAAAKVSPPYITPYSKNNRKGELIKGLQAALGGRIRVSPSCEDLITEFNDCRWSDTADNKIVNSSSYHLLDCAQYFADLIPDGGGRRETYTSHQDFIYRDNERRKAKEAAAAKKVASSNSRVATPRRKWRIGTGRRRSVWN